MYVCTCWFRPIDWHILPLQFLHLQEIVPAGPPGFYCSPQSSVCPCPWSTLLIQIFYCFIKIDSSAPCSFQTNHGHEDFNHFINIEVCSSTVLLASYEAMGILPLPCAACSNAGPPSPLRNSSQLPLGVSWDCFLMSCQTPTSLYIYKYIHYIYIYITIYISPQSPFLQTKQFQFLQLLLRSLVF